MADAGTAIRTQPLRVQLLGPVRAWRAERELDLGGPQRRAMLSMLAHSNQAMSRAELISGLWGLRPPASADHGIHVLISGLRRALDPARTGGPRAPSGQLLTMSGPLYWLRLLPGNLDTEAVDRHLTQARQLAPGDPAAAVRALDAALDLWHGTPLAAIPGPWADTERTRLCELRRRAMGDRMAMLLRLGAHHQVVTELAGAIREYPLHERFRGQLMLALYRCGRQSDALAAYAEARRVLAGQLGTGPGPALGRLHEQILAADQALDLPRPGRPAAGSGDGMGVPRVVSGWSGRRRGSTGPPGRRS